MGVELGIKPWGVSTESPLPMGFREGLKVGLGRGRQVANTCQSQHPGPGWRGGLYPADSPSYPQLTLGPRQLLAPGQSPHLHLPKVLVPQQPNEAPPTWTLAFGKHPHFLGEDAEAPQGQVTHPRSLDFQVAEPGFEPRSSARASQVALW